MNNSPERSDARPEKLDVFVERQIETNVEEVFLITHSRGCLAVVIDVLTGKRRKNLYNIKIHQTALAELCEIDVENVKNYFETAWLSGPLVTTEEFLRIKLDSLYTTPKGLEEIALIHCICARYFIIKQERENELSAYFGGSNEEK